jgi:hypothetical protein
MTAENPNEKRADLGALAIIAAADETNVSYVESAHTAIIDVLSYVAHFCNRFGLDPRIVFDCGFDSYRGDFADGPRVRARLNPDLGIHDQDTPLDR